MTTEEKAMIPEGKELPMDYKGHIAYRHGVAVKWSDELYTIEKKLVNKGRGTVKLLVDGRYRFWPTEVQWVPSDTQESSVWGQDGNVDFKKSEPGVRKSSRKRGP